MTINQRIKSIRTDNQLSQEQFAASLEMERANYAKLESGKQKPSIDLLSKIVRIYHKTYEWLIDGGIDSPSITLGEPQQEYVLRTDRRLEKQMVPLYDINAAAGLVAVFNGKQNIIDYISIPNMPKCDGAITVSGDSMYPLLKAGDIVAYKQMRDLPDSILWGEMYVLSVWMDEEDYVLVKYIQKSELGDEYIKLVSQNQHHASKDIKLKSIKALGLIKASIRFNSMN